MTSPVARRYARAALRNASALVLAKALKADADQADTQEDRQHLRRKAKRAEACAVTAVTRTHWNDDGTTSVITYNRRGCRLRLCPQCEARRAARERQRVRDIFAATFTTDPEARVLFVTLTSRNRPIAEAGAMFKDHEAALKRLWRQRRIVGATLGQLTALEIDVRGTRDNPEAGVHSHSAVFVAPGYFEDQRYLTQRQWAEHWQAALGSDYRPIVDVRVIRDAHGATDRGAVMNAARELAKYVTDPKGLIHMSETGLSADPRVVGALTRALHRRRLLRFDRIIADAAKRVRKAEGR